jgi:hypothetical protein
LYPGSGYVIVLKELPKGVCTIYLEPVVSTAEPLQQAKVMKRCTDEQELHVERLSCLSS